MENMINTENLNEVTDVVETNNLAGGLVSLAIAGGLFVGGIVTDKIISKVQPIKKAKAWAEKKKAEKEEAEAIDVEAEVEEA